jgi:hypothetical protein
MLSKQINMLVHIYHLNVAVKYGLVIVENDVPIGPEYISS